MIAAVCDGRSDRDSGLSLAEFANALVDLGAESAINLDGGGSASLLFGGRLCNRPREEHGIEILGGRPIATAIVFERVEPRALRGYLRRAARFASA
jgi:exopolysaccharide biosynthesis protein